MPWLCPCLRLTCDVHAAYHRYIHAMFCVYIYEPLTGEKGITLVLS